MIQQICYRGLDLLNFANSLPNYLSFLVNYQNVGPVASIPSMHELNIGHAIVARSIFVGFQQAVREMKELL